MPPMAVPLLVVMSKVTGLGDGLDRRTTKLALVVPSLPSTIDASEDRQLREVVIDDPALCLAVGDQRAAGRVGQVHGEGLVALDSVSPLIVTVNELLVAPAAMVCPATDFDT